MFKPKLPQQEQGFTLIEVLVAILLTTLFVAVAMQAIVSAAVFKVRAQEFSEATNWIREDLETVKSNAASLQNTTLTSSTGLNLFVKSVYGFKKDDVIRVGTAANFTTSTISEVSSAANKIALTVLPATSPVAGAIVVNTSRCGTASTPATDATGFADSLLDWLEDPIGGTDLIVTTKVNNADKIGKFNNAFILKRTTTVSTTPPFNMLEVSYDVSPTAGGASVAKLNTEVIPDAAFQCP